MRTALGVTLALLLLTVAATPPPGQSAQVTVGANSAPEQDELVNWAVGRFREAWMKRGATMLDVVDPTPAETAWERLSAPFTAWLAHSSCEELDAASTSFTGQAPTKGQTACGSLEGGEPSPAPVATPHTFMFRTESDAVLTAWALAQFERAGLQLPPLNIAFHDDKPLCTGHFGSYRSGTPDRIHICGFNWNRFLMVSKKTILHELGHAWAQHALTEETRQRFLRFRGLTTWADDDTPWEEKGFEQAAEIIAWALMDEEPLIAITKDADPRTLAQAYGLLTSSPPPAWARTQITVMRPVSPEDESLVYWALGRFREAGLVLPKVEVVFDPSGKACEGASGRLIDDGDEMRVALCTGQKGLTVTNRTAILHQLSHASLLQSVSAQVQTNFFELEDIETWNDPNQPSHLRGAEHAADIIAWAPMDPEVSMYRPKRVWNSAQRPSTNA